ncbi:MAG: NAD(P)H-dependent glycerol-3-phosphate dehydrogenase [Christensenellales bacterium]|jgi:glycerol-3-phosphate dehydrogenase (NAD(P)+)
MNRIAIIGAGMMGSAMSIPARDNGRKVRLVGTPLDDAIIEHARKTRMHLTMQRPLPEGIAFYRFDEACSALAGVDAIICGVSSFGVDWFLQQALPFIPPEVPVLSVTKGLVAHADGTLETYPAYYQRLSGRSSFYAIGGPCTSYELAERRHSAVVFCGSDMAMLHKLRTLLSTDYYHISLSTDVVGVEVAVALKNAYALAVTLAVGMVQRQDGLDAKPAYNPQAALFGQSVREMTELLKLLGGGPDNIVYGAGDLYVTIFGGRTRRLGTLLGRGLKINQALQQLEGVTLESVVVAQRMVQALRSRGQLAQFPLLHHVGRLLDGEQADIPWAALITPPQDKPGARPCI